MLVYYGWWPCYKNFRPILGCRQTNYRCGIVVPEVLDVAPSSPRHRCRHLSYVLRVRLTQHNILMYSPPPSAHPLFNTLHTSHLLFIIHNYSHFSDSTPFNTIHTTLSLFIHQITHSPTFLSVELL